MEVPQEPRGAAPGLRSGRLFLSLAALAAVVLALGLPRLPTAHTLGWDEAMHAALPAARMAVALDEGRPAEVGRVLLDCEQYPPGYPVLLALAQAAGGSGRSSRGGRPWPCWPWWSCWWACSPPASPGRPERRGRGRQRCWPASSS